MSHTNSTTNYNLPQFVGTDKPAWLGDINPAMSAIDSAIKTASDNATTADGKATSASETATANTSAIGTLANLTTVEKTNLVGAVNEVKSAVDVAQSTANTASGKAIATETALADFANTFNLSNKTTSSVGLNLLQDSTGSIFKLYGQWQMSAGTVLQRTAIPGLSGYYGFQTSLELLSQPSEGYVVEGAGFRIDINTSDTQCISASNIQFAVGTDGKIYIWPTTASGAYTVATGRFIRNWFPPCIYFNKNLGDIVQPTE